MAEDIEDFEKTEMNLQVTLDIDDQLTWGELIRFVDLARSRGVDPETPVVLNYDSERDRYTGICLYLAPEGLPPEPS